jgi:C4-type zinc ribbon domain
MKDLIEQLLALQTLELGPSTEPSENEAAVARLRQRIPAQILAHYDRLMARGRKGVSLVRNGVCTECHMRLASGTHAQLLRHEDVIICDSCGRYLLAVAEPAPDQPEPAPTPAAPPPEKKRRRKKAEKVA